jgi:Na+/proline symporter
MYLISLCPPAVFIGLLGVLAVGGFIGSKIGKPVQAGGVFGLFVGQVAALLFVTVGFRSWDSFYQVSDLMSENLWLVPALFLGVPTLAALVGHFFWKPNTSWSLKKGAFAGLIIGYLASLFLFLVVLAGFSAM